MRDNTSIQDIEWMLAKSVAFDAGYALVTSSNLVAANGFGNEILEKTKQWKIARMSNTFSVEQKKRMEDIKAEFVLETISENSWHLVQQHIDRFEHPFKIRQPGEPLWSDFLFDNKNAAQALQFILTTKNTSVSDIALELNNFKKIQLKVELREGEYLKYDGGSKVVL